MLFRSHRDRKDRRVPQKTVPVALEAAVFIKEAACSPGKARFHAGERRRRLFGEGFFGWDAGFFRKEEAPEAKKPACHAEKPALWLERRVFWRERRFF